MRVRLPCGLCWLAKNFVATRLVFVASQYICPTIDHFNGRCRCSDWVNRINYLNETIP